MAQALALPPLQLPFPSATHFSQHAPPLAVAAASSSLASPSSFSACAPSLLALTLLSLRLGACCPPVPLFACSPPFCGLVPELALVNALSLVHSFAASSLFVSYPAPGLTVCRERHDVAAVAVAAAVAAAVAVAVAAAVANGLKNAEQPQQVHSNALLSQILAAVPAHARKPVGAAVAVIETAAAVAGTETVAAAAAVAVAFVAAVANLVADIAKTDPLHLDETQSAHVLVAALPTLAQHQPP